MDALHWTWHTITTRPGIDVEGLKMIAPYGRGVVWQAILELLGAEYIAYNGAYGFYALVPFVAVRQAWEVVGR